MPFTVESTLDFSPERKFLSVSDGEPIQSIFWRLQQEYNIDKGMNVVFFGEDGSPIDAKTSQKLSKVQVVSFPASTVDFGGEHHASLKWHVAVVSGKSYVSPISDVCAMFDFSSRIGASYLESAVLLTQRVLGNNHALRAKFQMYVDTVVAEKYPRVVATSLRKVFLLLSPPILNADFALVVKFLLHRLRETVPLLVDEDEFCDYCWLPLYEMLTGDDVGRSDGGRLTLAEVEELGAKVRTALPFLLWEHSNAKGRTEETQSEEVVDVGCESYRIVLDGPQMTLLHAGDVTTTEGVASPTPATEELHDRPGVGLLPVAKYKELKKVGKKVTTVNVMVVDSSGSMQSSAYADGTMSRFDAAQGILSCVLDRMVGAEGSHCVGIVSFQSGNAVVHTDITTNVADVADGGLGRGFETDGSTPLWDSIVTAVETGERYLRMHIADPGFSPDAKVRVFVLTDGQDNCSQFSAVKAAAFARRTGAIIDAFCIGQVDDTCLRGVVNASGGLLFYAETYEDALGLLTDDMALEVDARDESEEKSAQCGKEGDCVLKTASDLKQWQCLERYPRVTLHGKADRTGSSGETASLVKRSISIVTKLKRGIGSAFKSKASAVTVVASGSSSSPVASQTVGNGLGMAACRRLMKEIKQASDEGMRIVTVDESLDKQMVTIDGPAGSHYEGLSFDVLFTIPSDYPFKAPIVRFVTPIFHPNISSQGSSCMAELQTSWSPAITISKLVYSIVELLREPNHHDSLNVTAAQLHRDDPKLFAERVRATTMRAKGT